MSILSASPTSSGEQLKDKQHNVISFDAQRASRCTFTASLRFGEMEVTEL